MKTRHVKYKTHMGCLVEQTKRMNTDLGRIELDIVLSGPKDLDNVAALPRQQKRSVSRDFITGNAG